MIESSLCAATTTETGTSSGARARGLGRKPSDEREHRWISRVHPDDRGDGCPEHHRGDHGVAGRRSLPAASASARNTHRKRGNALCSVTALTRNATSATKEPSAISRASPIWDRARLPCASQRDEDEPEQRNGSDQPRLGQCFEVQTVRAAGLGTVVDADPRGVVEVSPLEVGRSHAFDRMCAPHLDRGQVLARAPAQRRVGAHGRCRELAELAYPLRDLGWQQEHRGEHRANGHEHDQHRSHMPEYRGEQRGRDQGDHRATRERVDERNCADSADEQRDALAPAATAPRARGTRPARSRRRAPDRSSWR